MAYQSRNTGAAIDNVVDAVKGISETASADALVKAIATKLAEIISDNNDKTALRSEIIKLIGGAPLTKSQVATALNSGEDTETVTIKGGLDVTGAITTGKKSTFKGGASKG